LLGSLITLVLPRNLIGLIGLFPIAVGIKEILELRKIDSEKSDNRDQDSEESIGVSSFDVSALIS
jgi:cadmium resistance protein CadD (predicted permease)